MEKMRLETERIVRLKRTEYHGLIDYREAAIYLGYGEQEPDAATDAELRQCAQALLDAMEPRYMFRTVRLLRGEEESAEGKDVQREEAHKGTARGESGRKENVQSGGADEKNGREYVFSAEFSDGNLKLPGAAIRKHLGASEYAVAACLTLGEGADELIDRLQRQSMLSALLTDALANAAVERLRLQLEGTAAKETGWRLGWLFGIGYDDLPLFLQPEFLRYMHAKEGIGLAVSEKLILSPSKSVTGFLNIKSGEDAKRSRCNGRCGTCLRREECRFFRGSR